ncbi:MAG: DMT family transporter [Muricoprocola sp.]
MKQETHPLFKTSSVQGYFFLLLTVTLWGSLYVVSKYTLGKLPTFTISFIRFILAFLFLFILAPKPSKKLAREHVPYILCIGFVGYFIAIGAQLLGTKYAGASMASLLNSMNPVTMTIFSAIILHEKLTFRKILGILLAVFGVYVILGGNTIDAALPGILLSLFSVITWSFVSVLVRKVTAQYDALYITRLGFGVAAVCYLPVAIGELIMTKTNVISVLSQNPSCLLALIYMALMCTGIAHLLWNKSLAILDVSVCSAFYPIQPMVSTLLGVLLLGEQVTWVFGVGALLIVAGVLISLSK